MGAQRWRTTPGSCDSGSAIERHSEVVQSQLAHFGGREIKQIGDGLLSAFDSLAKAIRSAMSIFQAMPNLGLQVRAGDPLGRM
jgi:class 3 adenylate cyclase